MLEIDSVIPPYYPHHVLIFCPHACWNTCFFQQAVGYNSIEAEDWELATNGEEMSKLEALLLDKNRKMEHELTQLKVGIV
jgi:hypothetical protein